MPTPPDADPKPHPLALYRWSVQSPEITAGLLLRAWEHHNPAGLPAVLREDFAGSCALAAAWVDLHETHRADAVEIDPATLNWARRCARAPLGPRAGDLRLHLGDVLKVQTPPADVVAALNFSTLIYHEPESLRRYLAAACAQLAPGGVLVLDCFGGPGARQTGIETVPIAPPPEADLPPYEYQWEQRRFDLATGRIDCRIHFRLEDGQTLPDAFVYDWRLWTPAELITLLKEVGLADISLWQPGDDPTQGWYTRVHTIDETHDFVAYLAAHKP